MTPQPEDPLALLRAIYEGSPETLRERLRANLEKFDEAFFGHLTEMIRQARAQNYEQGAELLESFPKAISEARIGKDNGLEWQVAMDALARGQRHFDAGEWHGSRRDAEEALNISRRIGDRYGAASALMLLAKTDQEAHDWGRALANYRQAADESRAHRFWRLEAAAIFSAGELLRAGGDDSQARPMFERCLEIGADLDLGDMRALGHLQLGCAYLGKELDAAEQHLLAALAEAQAAQNLFVSSQAALNLGNIHLSRHNPEAARPFLLQAKEAFEAQNNAAGVTITGSLLERTEVSAITPNEAEKFTQLDAEGRASLEAGDLERTEAMWMQAVAVARKTGNHFGEAKVLMDLGKLYRDQRNDPAGALRTFGEALRAARLAAHAQIQAGILNAMGRIHRSLGQRSEAKQAFESAVAAAELAGDPNSLGIVLINLGNEHKFDRELLMAKPYYLRALELGEKTKDDEMRVLALGNLGNVEEMWQNMTAAEDLYRKGLEIAEAARYAQGIANQSNNLGSLFSKLHNWQVSVSFFERALEVANSMKDPELQIAGLRNLALALDNCGRGEEALQRLNQAALIPAVGVRPDIVDSVYELRAEMYAKLNETTAADSDWLTLSRRIEARCDGEFALARDIGVYQPLAQTALKRLSHALSFSDSAQIAGQIEAMRAKPFCITSGAPVLDAKGISRLLESRPEPTAFVHFAVLQEKIVVVAQQPGWPSPKVEAVNLTLQDLADARTRQLQEVERHLEQPELDETWLDIISDLAGAVAELVAGCDVAYLCPHSLLWYFPLHAAVIDDAPLLERLPIVYVDSATRLAHLWQTPPKPLQNCFAAGVGLTSNDDVLFQGEAKVVAQMFGAEPLVGYRVTRQRILNGMLGNDVVHLSTHGRWGFKSTSLVLRDESELLFASDIERLKMPARLVYLSGCDSAWLDTTAISIGMRGFPAAFLEAGANSVIAASWPVSAPASIQIVSAFYRELQKPGASVAKALQQAQLEIRKRPYYGGRTYYWAPFSLVGDGR